MKRKSKEVKGGQKVKKQKVKVDDDKQIDLGVVIDDTENWSRLINICSTMSDECIFKFGEKGMSIGIMDVGLTSGLKAYIPRKYFLDYHVEGKRDIGVNVKFLKELNKYLKNDNYSNDLLIGEKDNKLIYSIVGDKKRNMYDLDIIDTSNIKNTIKTVPKIDYDIEINIMVRELLDIFDCGSKLSDFCKLVEIDGKLNFKSDNYAIGRFNTILGKELVKGNYAGFIVKFNTKLALRFFSHLPLDSVLKMQMKSNCPIYTKIKGGFIKYRYWLAPMIEFEGDNK